MKLMKKMSLLLLALVLMVGVLLINAPEAQAATYSGSCGAEGDNLTWTLDTSSGTLTISGTGAMESFLNSVSTPWCDYCESITAVVITDGATDIGKWAFSHCTNLTSVTIPDSVTSIDTCAFYNCTGLEKINIPDSVTTMGVRVFYKCTGLTSVTIPDSVVSIGQKLFEQCTNLTDVTIGDGVTSISGYAFYFCSSLTNVTFGNCITSIGEYAFYYCTSLTSVVIPDGVTSIGNSAYSNCTNLTSVTIPDSVTSVGDWAFYYSTKLTDVYYGGTQEQWAKISIGSNTWLRNIHYIEPEVFAIVNQPADQTAANGETAQFAVEATGVASYRWQYSKNGTTWYATKLTGYDTATLSVPVTAGRNGYQYRCKLTGEDGSVLYTDVASLTMQVSTTITAAPTDQTVTQGTVAEFAVAGTQIKSYQWYYRKSAASSWCVTKLSGCTGDTLSVAALIGRNGYQYRCKLTGEDGTVLYTELVTLTVTSCISAQPENQSSTVGGVAQFSVQAQNVAGYQWQYRKSGGSWCTTKLSGFDTDTLSVDAAAHRDGYQYRCKLILTDGTVVYTDIATLSVSD